MDLAKNGLANSNNCKNYFMQFSRKCKAKDFPISLGPELESDQLNLFNLWLQCGKDMKKLELTVKRTAEKSDEGQQLWETMKIVDLKKLYTEEKVKAITAKKDKAGHYDPDLEFPDDPQERSYWMYKQTSFVRSNKMAESMEVSGKNNWTKMKPTR